jgi:hypothetical protein
MTDAHSHGISIMDAKARLRLTKSAISVDANSAVLSLGDMRRAIEFGAQTSGLVRECLETAQLLRLGREETYVLIAYKALRSLEDVLRDRELKAARSAEHIRHRLRDGHF